MEQHTPCLRRRTLLSAAGLVGASATVLSACGGAGAPTVSGTTGADGSVRYALGDIEVGASAYDSRERIILSRPEEGTVVAFDATCPHQGCAVSEVADGALVCPCHDSSFDATTGAPLAGPAVTGLTVLPSTLEGEEIVVRG